MGKKSANAEKKLPPLKPILALPTWGQMWILSELWVLEKGNFDLGHPVVGQELPNVAKWQLLKLIHIGKIDYT